MTPYYSFLLLLLFTSFAQCEVRNSHNTEFCDACKIVVTLVRDYAEQNATEDALFKFMEDDLCPALVQFIPETVVRKLVT
jgi:hypothetical protein